jgi:hypothetical protein
VLAGLAEGQTVGVSVSPGSFAAEPESAQSSEGQ